MQSDVDKTGYGGFVNVRAEQRSLSLRVLVRLELEYKCSLICCLENRIGIRVNGLILIHAG